MSAIKKAFRTSMRRTRYSMFEQKENDYIRTPTSKRVCDSEEREIKSASVPSRRQSAVFRRGSQMTRSVRDAVGTIRQKFKISTRRMKPLQEHGTPVHCTSRRSTQGAKEVPLYSPFRIETPGKVSSGRVCRRSNIRTIATMETPTRLKREVEALTANMQALSALTPNTLQARTRRSQEKSGPITNGSLKTPRSARRRIVNSPAFT